ncbi:uncharacterized protein ACJ7VT_021923 isoform 2-T2 [Polymixia lowei]
MAAPLPQMATFWIGLLVAGVVLVSIIVLAAMCLNCRSKGPLVSITQERRNNSEEYISSTGFGIIHHHSYQQPNNPTHLPPFSPSIDRPRSFTPTENGGDYVNPPEDDSDKEAYIEVLPDLPPGFVIRPSSCTSTHSSGSLPRYENPVYGHDYEDPPEDSDKGAYIQVLPDPPPFEIRQSSQSLASTHSSDAESSYVNVKINQEYTNVNPLQNPGATMATSTDKDSDDDEEEEDTYVNQPAMIDNLTNALQDLI